MSRLNVALPEQWDSRGQVDHSGVEELEEGMEHAPEIAPAVFQELPLSDVEPLILAHVEPVAQLCDGSAVFTGRCV